MVLVMVPEISAAVVGRSGQRQLFSSAGQMCALGVGWYHLPPLVPLGPTTLCKQSPVLNPLLFKIPRALLVVKTA